MKTFEEEFDDDDEDITESLHTELSRADRPQSRHNSQDQPSDDDEDFPDNLPSISSRYDLIPKVDYDFEPFMPVQEVTDDVKTTESDLALLNNSMAVMDAALKKVTTVDSAKKIVESMIKLIECRRKVKKLQYGTAGSVLLKDARGYEVLE